jgi:gluconokinase
VQQSFDPAGVTPRAIVVMGVCASGKSTIGALLAHKLGCQFFEGDTFHSQASIEKMRAGQPLTDDDRWPWLDRLGGALQRAVSADGVAVAACSALKVSYRERLRELAKAPMSFIMLKAEEAELARRLQNRPDHYMPASLLASQLAALEEPTPQEPAVTLDAREAPEEICAAAWTWLVSPSALRTGKLPSLA